MGPRSSGRPLRRGTPRSCGRRARERRPTPSLQGAAQVLLCARVEHTLRPHIDGGVGFGGFSLRRSGGICGRGHPPPGRERCRTRRRNRMRYAEGIRCNMIAFGALVTVSLPIFTAAAGGVAVMLGSSRAGRQKKSEVGQIESGRAEAKRERGVLRRLLGELRPYTLSVVGVFFVLLSATPLTLLTPVPLKIIVDSVLGTQPLPSYLKAVFPWLSGLSASLLVVFAISMLLVLTLLTNFQLLLVVWSTTKLGNRMTLNMRARLFRAMQRLSIAYHDRRGTAYSSHRVQYDAPSVDRFTTGDLLPISAAVVTLAR